MNNTFKAVIFDVDGTLFDYRYLKIHDATIDAINKLKALGMIIIVASGRSYPLLGEDCIKNVAPDYYISSNGHSILDCEGRSVFSSCFTYEQTQKVVELTKEHGNGLMLKYNDLSYIYTDFDNMFEIFNNIHLKRDDFIYCPSMNHHEKELPIGFTIKGCSEVKSILAGYENDYKVELFHDVTECDVFSPSINKMTGMKYLSNILNITPKNIISFGDGRNDIEILKWSGIGVAMGNATNEVKDAADIVCAPSWENGIANSLNEIFDLAI